MRWMKSVVPPDVPQSAYIYTKWTFIAPSSILDMNKTWNGPTIARRGTFIRSHNRSGGGCVCRVMDSRAKAGNTQKCTQICRISSSFRRAWWLIQNVCCCCFVNNKMCRYLFAIDGFFLGGEIVVELLVEMLFIVATFGYNLFG